MLRVDADIIHEHLLRKLSCCVRRAGPRSADSDIQNNEKGMIENPSSIGGPVRLVEGRVVVRIDVKTDLRRLPFNRIDVKVCKEIRTIWKGCAGSFVRSPCHRTWS